MHKKVDYNIEYAHIYINESFSKEHIEGVRILKKITRELKRKGKTYTLTVLIDDYNPSESILDINYFIDRLDKLGARPDYVGYESKLAQLKDLVINELSKKSRKQYTRYITQKNRVPCSLLITIWHLLRLGLLKSRIKFYDRYSNKKSFEANKIITILPGRFKIVEKKAQENIKSIRPRNNIVDKLEYIYY